MTTGRRGVGQKARAQQAGRAWLVVAAIAASLVVTACGSDSSVSTGPTQSKCQVTLAAASSTLGADGGLGSVTVTASPECPWTVSTAASWLSELTPASGQGNGTVQFRAAPNTAPATREGEIVVNENRVRLSQQAAPCRFELTPATLDADAIGGTRQVQVAATSGCAWTLTADVPWISFGTPPTGSSDATATVIIAAHGGSQPRVGAISLGDRRVVVTQAGVPPAGCAYDVGPAAQSIAATGGAGVPVTVTTTGGCAWTATSSVPWIAITSGASSSGSGVATFSAAANPGAARTGTILVAGQTVTISQGAASAEPGCTYIVSATGGTIAAGGGSGNVTVAVGPGCPWNAVSSAAWITITAGASGSGNGTVAYTAAANTGSARTGTITVAGQPVTVTQEAGTTTCTYAISATTASMPAPGGTGSVDVSAAAGCAWSASSNVPWITITAGASGSGPVAFSVAANAGAARTGTLTVAGQTFTVDQAAAPAPCTYTLSAGATSVPATGGSGNVGVTAASGCAWTATSNAAWITVTAGGAGDGNGTVAFTVAANSGAARTGTLTVAGQTFTVDQAAAPVPCVYTLSANAASVPAPGGAVSVSVAAVTGCAWTATSNAPWMTVTSGGTGSGNGTVSFAVAANSGAARTGTLTVAGQTFTVDQAAAPAACVYALSAPGRSVNALGGSGSVDVVTTATCAWTAASNAGWITVLTGGSGTGNGTVTFAVAPNLGAARTGTMTVAGQTYTVNQAAVLPTCSYTLNPSTATFPRQGGANSVAVAAGPLCAWTATSNVSWITITSGAIGLGNGTVGYNVASKPGNNLRTGTLTIGGQTFTVTHR